MDVTADDNFFIKEPQKLRNNFFNKDKSIQLVELLNKSTRHNHLHHHDNANTNTNKRIQPIRVQQPRACRLTYTKKLQQLHQPQQTQLQQQQLQQHATTTMPKSFITRLEILCQATYTSDDISVAKRAVDSLVSASKSGCCFLEKYIVMLLNFCTKQHPVSDEALKIKIDELLNRVLIVEFDRQQMTENLRRPEYKLNSVKQIIQILKRVQDMLDYRERKAVDWLSVVLDAYFVELATTNEADEIIDQISAHINFQCALLCESESAKCLLRTIIEMEPQHNTKGRVNMNSALSKTAGNQVRLKRTHYSIESIEI